jgi:hypothetical protein
MKENNKRKMEGPKILGRIKLPTLSKEDIAEDKERRIQFLKSQGFANEEEYKKHIAKVERELYDELKKSGFTSENEYYQHLENKEREAQNKERLKYGLSWENYKLWSNLMDGESRYLINGVIPAIEKDGEIIELVEEKPDYGEDEEWRIMRNIMNGNGDLEGY